MDENPYESPKTLPPVETGSLLSDPSKLGHLVVAGVLLTVGLTSLVVTTIIEGDRFAVMKSGVILAVTGIGGVYLWARSRPRNS